MYQKEWQGIRFDEVATTCSSRLAEAEFYEAFYRALFSRYQGYEDLDAGWRASKKPIADFILGRLEGGGRVLSIGCGLGYVEQLLAHHADYGIEVSVQDIAPTALAWLREHIPPERMHVGMPPGCLPRDGRYELIYMSAVDYALDDETLVQALKALSDRVTEGGEITLFSASFHDVDGRARSLLQNAKDLGAAALERLGVHDRGQFWGWARSRQEYRGLMGRVGFRVVDDGFLHEEDRNSYWITGRK